MPEDIHSTISSGKGKTGIKYGCNTQKTNVMISFIIWIIGVVLTIKAAMDIWQLSGDKVKKILFIAVIVLTSWLGLIFYYLIGKDKMPQWVK